MTNHRGSEEIGRKAVTMTNSGIPYYPLFCRLDDEFRSIETEFGLKGLAILVIKLYGKIYGEKGYYCKCDFDAMESIRKNCDIPQGDQIVSEVIHAALKKGIFSKTMYKEYGILTSATIQLHYLNAVQKRTYVDMEKAYLLLSDDKIPKTVRFLCENSGRPKTRHTNALDFDVENKSKTQDQYQKKKVKVKEKIKEKEKSKVNQDLKNNNKCVGTGKNCLAASLMQEQEHFLNLWSMYPVKRGRGLITKKKKADLYKITKQEMERAIQRYLAYVSSVDYLHIQHGSTFFCTGYLDYLDANYEPVVSIVEGERKKNRFYDFPQREYDMGILEKELLKKQTRKGEEHV